MTIRKLFFAAALVCVPAVAGAVPTYEFDDPDSELSPLFSETCEERQEQMTEIFRILNEFVRDQFANKVPAGRVIDLPSYLSFIDSEKANFQLSGCSFQLDT